MGKDIEEWRHSLCKAEEEESQCDDDVFAAVEVKWVGHTKIGALKFGVEIIVSFCWFFFFFFFVVVVVHYFLGG